MTPMPKDLSLGLMRKIFSVIPRERHLAACYRCLEVGYPHSEGEPILTHVLPALN